VVRNRKNDRDESILVLLRHKNTQDRGFRLLTDQYQERLYRHIRRMVREHADADDVLQNTLIKVYRNIHQFGGRSSLFTWLYRIATNEALSYLSAKKQRSTMEMPGDSEQADTPVDGDRLLQLLHKAVDQLPDKQRIVFHMRYFEEMPYEAISGILDTSTGALKASFHHAVKKIESFMRAHMDT
jgi:RNA polymerase sigma-70 factor (ECF subfamily)